MSVLPPNSITMKIFYVIILTLFTSTLTWGQEDSTATELEGLEGRTLEVSVGSKGGVKVSNPYDTSATGAENDTIRISTKRKNILIITEPRKTAWTISNVIGGESSLDGPVLISVSTILSMLTAIQTSVVQMSSCN